jgi:hypothetical protein
MTKADQDRWQADMVRVGTLTDFLKWCPTVRAADITGPIREHHWSSWLSAEMVSAGIDWLNTLREDLYGKAKKAG